MAPEVGWAYARVWAQQQVIGALGGRTVDAALAAGVPPKQVWWAAAETLGIPEPQR